ncbi:L-proline trans-4-hydroxylase-like [Haliotis rufescens]|uniref:L-proline trans-4-hydroxylase-like n=1 Tax=Haliotis rufescens TaxID=6454 RepID=UPI00201F3682|nr:L-proline trans-4-hydroxylase-like [Haliotis rufescens]
MATEFTYKPGFKASDDMKKAFDEYGYIIIRGLLNTAELNKVKKALEENGEILKHSFGLSDGNNRKSRLCVWSHPGSDITGMVSRSERVAGTVEKLLGGDVYHYHSKLMMKEAQTGGSFVWHQDYGYWYHNGLLKPDMLAVFTAIDKCDKENGCLEILEKSHKCGRIEHKFVAGQIGADLERVELVKSMCKHRHVELEQGDALFFHCNMLHNSAANNSDKRRWVLITAFNTLNNNSVVEHHHPPGTKIDIVSDNAILACTNYNDMTGKRFMDPTANKTIKVDN